MKTLLTLFILSFSFITTSAQAKSIKYDVVEIEAYLNSKGELEITESQSIYYDGAWNGGYRRFHLKGNQKINFMSLKRSTTVGVLEPLKQGSTKKKFHYQVKDNTVTWRNRLKSDPPFNNIYRIYVLKYKILNALIPKQKELFLDYDFLFKERIVPIKNVRLKLKLDPFWQLEKNEIKISKQNVQPNEGLNQNLEFGSSKDKKLQSFFRQQPQGQFHMSYGKAAFISTGIIFLLLLLWRFLN